jgi:fatty-acyl-CoA synthase
MADGRKLKTNPHTEKCEMPAYNYQLLIKQLLHTPLANAADQEIVYREGCHQV